MKRKEKQNKKNKEQKENNLKTSTIKIKTNSSSNSSNSSCIFKLNPQAKEWLPSSIIKYQQEYPILTTSQQQQQQELYSNFKKEKKLQLNYKNAIKINKIQNENENEIKKDKIELKNEKNYEKYKDLLEKNSMILLPIGKSDSLTKSLESLSSLSPSSSSSPQPISELSTNLELKNENDSESKQQIQQQSINSLSNTYSKPSIAAIQRWKFKWFQIAKTIRENIKSEEIHQLNEQNNLKEKHNLWHQALTPANYLDQMATPPLFNSQNNNNNNNNIYDDSENDNNSNDNSNDNDNYDSDNSDNSDNSNNSNFSEYNIVDENNINFSMKDWWEAIENGDIIKLKLYISGNSTLSKNWRRLIYHQVIQNNDSEIIREMDSLHYAVYCQQLGCVKLLIDSGIGVESRDNFKRTGILIAAEVGNLDILLFLLDSGSSLTSKDKELNSILHCACLSTKNYITKINRKDILIEKLKVIQWLSEKCKSKILNINARNRQRNTALMIAIEMGNRDIVSTLLYVGADPTYTNIHEDDAICLATRKGNIKILELILSSNYRGKLQGVHKNSSLKPVVQTIEKSSKNKLPSISPLTIAVKDNNIECIRLFLSHGISINIFDDIQIQHKGIKFYALSPIMIASILGYKNIIEYFVSPELFNSFGQFLLINVTDRNGLTALGCACLFGHLDCIKLITKYYPESLNFSYRFNDNETVPESVVRNLIYLSKEDDRKEAFKCLSYLFSIGAPLTEKFIRRLISLKSEDIQQILPFEYIHEDKEVKNQQNTLQQNHKTLIEWNISNLPYYDVIIFVPNNEGIMIELYCHSFILEIHSETFKTMIHSSLINRVDGKINLKFPDINLNTMNLLLSWMYLGGDITSQIINFELIIDLMIVANEFFISRLQRLCEHRLCKYISLYQIPEENIIGLRELAKLLHLDHLLVYLTHHTNLLTMIKPDHLINHSINSNDINYKMKPVIFPYLCYNKSSNNNNNNNGSNNDNIGNMIDLKTCLFEKDFILNIIENRLLSLSLPSYIKKRFKIVSIKCLDKIFDTISFSLASFLIDIYSLSQNTIKQCKSDDIYQYNQIWKKIWNNDNNNNNNNNSNSDNNNEDHNNSNEDNDNLYFETYIRKVDSTTLFTKILYILFPSLVEFSIFTWNHLKSLKINQNISQSIEFEGEYIYYTTLDDFISDEMYNLLWKHVILSSTHYQKNNSLSIPDTLLNSSNLLIECENNIIRNIHLSLMCSKSLKIQTLINLYLQSHESEEKQWNYHLKLNDVDINDFDNLLCYAYLGYIPHVILPSREIIPKVSNEFSSHHQNTSFSNNDNNGYNNNNGNNNNNNFGKDINNLISENISNLIILSDEYLLETLKTDLSQILLTCITKENCIDVFLVSSIINSIPLKLKSSLVFLFNYEYFQFHQQKNIHSNESDEVNNTTIKMLSNDIEMTIEDLFNLLFESYI